MSCALCIKVPEAGGRCEGCETLWAPDELGTLQKVIHEEAVPEYRTWFQRLMERFRHQHVVVRRTWTLDNSSWATDPNALEFCACGAYRPLWMGFVWMEPRA